MSGVALLSETERVLQQVSEPDVRCYLDEALKCFSAEAYDAAIVMAWSATIAHLIHQVNKIGLEVFQYAFRQEYPDRKKLPNTPDDLVGDDDKAFIQVCGQMRFLRVKSADLHRFRDHRNNSAHPNQNPAGQPEAEWCLKLCLEVVRYPAESVRIRDDALLVEYALRSGSSAETIVDLIDSDFHLSTATKLLDAYLNNSGPEYDTLVGIWRRLWDLLNETDRTELWGRLENEVVRALEGHNDVRNGEELARFIVWPVPNQSNHYRDSIARRYVSDLKRKVQDGSFSSEDKEFALWLYERLPGEFQSQIVHLCTRWLVKRVRQGNFDGRDLDFNAWLKMQSGPNQQRRFQTIRDAIVRRY
ncbi:MAG: hypothetical protein NUW24_11025 [Anaerolineae bacterium]|jgi:hypothetical protein|nr:hypothetical protein [Anaerolineae bacterium]MDH7475142.1 hypothetical protein [Anaerolineae bacterium]